MTKVSKIR